MCHDIIQPSPEFRHLGAAELDRAIDDATIALEAAKEALLTLQDERYRRRYLVTVLRQLPDWPQPQEQLFDWI